MPGTTDALPFRSDTQEREGGIVLYNVSWEAYEGLLRVLGDDHPSLRVTYLSGTLQMTKTSREQERLKKVISRLLQAWVLAREVRLEGYGSATFCKQEIAWGLEPDECYALGELGDAPDLAIEVVETHGTVDKMAVYAGLGVREVWVWEADNLRINVLRGGRYVTAETSDLLPTLNVAEFAAFVRQGEQDQTATVRRYRHQLGQAG
jgi:Uma2 family endonuclease